MTGGSASRLERVLRRGSFAVTAEVVPPRSANPDDVRIQARGLVGYADAVNITDNPAATVHMSPLAGAALAAAAGVEPVVQLACRDRNRLALSSDLLGAWALGARNVLCLTGDPPSVGDHPEAKDVFDLSVVDLVSLANGLRKEGRLLSGAQIADPPKFFIGVADSPLVASYDPSRLEMKADAGADFVQTQIVFDVDLFVEWARLARARGIFERMFSLVGVAVPSSAKAARYLRDHLPGVVVPEGLISALEDAGPEAEAEGVRLTVEAVTKLRQVDGVAGIHVMGLGRMEPVRGVIEGAGLLPRPVIL